MRGDTHGWSEESDGVVEHENRRTSPGEQEARHSQVEVVKLDEECLPHTLALARRHPVGSQSRVGRLPKPWRLRAPMTLQTFPTSYPYP